MILTRTHLNARRQGAHKLLASPQAMHAAILSGFPPGHTVGRTLWRLDPDDALRPTLYVLSPGRPDLTHLEEQAGWPSHPTTVAASYAPLLESLSAGQVWAFRLKANPTHRATIRGTKRIVAHVTIGHQEAWLRERGARLGVEFGDDADPTVRVTKRQVLEFRRGEDRVTLGVASFSGLLRVRDPDLLRIALTEGIGRGKAYGCGLMTLARPQ